MNKPKKEIPWWEDLWASATISTFVSVPGLFCVRVLEESFWPAATPIQLLELVVLFGSFVSATGSIMLFAKKERRIMELERQVRKGN